MRVAASELTSHPLAMRRSAALDLAAIETRLRAHHAMYPLEHTSHAIDIVAGLQRSTDATGCLPYRWRLLSLSDCIKNVQVVNAMEGRTCDELEHIVGEIDAATKWTRFCVRLWTSCSVFTVIVTAQMTQCVSHCKRGT